MNTERLYKLCQEGSGEAFWQRNKNSLGLKLFPEKKLLAVDFFNSWEGFDGEVFCDLASVFQPGGFQPVHMLVIIQLID